jgi:hypothetical protein
MGIGMSLHVGINVVDGSAFPSALPLEGPENDARAMCCIAKEQGFTERRLLLGARATYDNVEKAIRQAACALKDGDIFLFTFAGHGSGESDLDGDEPDQQDETLVLFDRMLFDDVLERDLWPGFREGVRILMVSDSCHSGTLLKRVGVTTSVRREERFSLGGIDVALTTEMTVPKAGVFLARTISAETSRLHLKMFDSFYREKLGALPPAATIEASVLLLSACRDDEEAADDFPHGVFTQALLDVWGEGSFNGGHEKFRADIRALIPAGLMQHPRLTPSQPPNEAFIAQRPFTIPFP